MIEDDDIGEMIETTRRLRLVEVSAEAILGMFTQRLGDAQKWMRYRGLPPDAEAMAVMFDFPTDVFLVKMRSVEFSEIPEGQAIPRIVVTVEVRDDADSDPVED